MKAIDLAKLLLENPDFDVKVVISEKDNSEWGITVKLFDIIRIGDIGVSEKVILLATLAEFNSNLMAVLSS